MIRYSIFWALGIVMFLATSTFAAADSAEEIELCTWIDQRIGISNAKVGLKCRSSYGAVFERVEHSSFGLAWKAPDGLVWTDHVRGGTFLGAAFKCHKIEGRLPTVEQFRRASSQGISELMSLASGMGYWTRDAGGMRNEMKTVRSVNDGNLVVDSFHIRAVKAAVCVIALP